MVHQTLLSLPFFTFMASSKVQYKLTPTLISISQSSSCLMLLPRGASLLVLKTLIWTWLIWHAKARTVPLWIAYWQTLFGFSGFSFMTNINTSSFLNGLPDAVNAGRSCLSYKWSSFLSSLMLAACCNFNCNYNNRLQTSPPNTSDQWIRAIDFLESFFGFTSSSMLCNYARALM